MTETFMNNISPSLTHAVKYWNIGVVAVKGIQLRKQM